MGEICELLNGSQLDKKNIIKGKYPVYSGGVGIIGYHNSYNREDCVIISATGSCGNVNYNPNKFWASQCLTIKSIDNRLNNMYLLCYLKIIEDKLKSGYYGKGSVQKFLRVTDLQSIEIPIPKTDKLLKEWVTRISTPYDTIQRKKRELEGLEDEIKTEVQRIGDEESCRLVPLGELCEYKDKPFKIKHSDAIENGKYPLYSSGETIGRTNQCMFENKYLIIGTVRYIRIRTAKNFSIIDTDIVVLHSATISNDYICLLFEFNS